VPKIVDRMHWYLDVFGWDEMARRKMMKRVHTLKTEGTERLRMEGGCRMDICDWIS